MNWKTEFSVLHKRWQELTTPIADGTIPLQDMYADAEIASGYELSRQYGMVGWAGTRGELDIQFSKDYIRIIQGQEILREDTKFHNLLSIKERRIYIKAMLQRDPVVRRFATLIDKGDELIIEIRKPKDKSDDE